PDGDDILFGGAGTQITRNNAQNVDGTLTDLTRHAKDADTIAGDNANIIRIVGTNGVDVNPTGNLANPLYVTFTYDNYGPTKLIVRGVTLLDYTPGGPDANPTTFATVATAGFRNEFGIYAVNDIGGHDEVHGEMGDDTA